MNLPRYRCKTCKGTNVEEQVWFNPNTGDVKDNCFNTTYCHDCERTSEDGNVEEIPLLDLQIVAAIRAHGPIARDTSNRNDFQDSVVFLVSRSSGLVDAVRLWIKRPGDAGLPDFTLEYYTYQSGPSADCSEETLERWMDDAHGDWGTLCKGDDAAAIVTAFGYFFVRGMRASWRLNGEPVDIDEFVDANRDGMPPDDLAEVLAMQPGQTFRAGGGAAPEWSITRGDG